MWPLEIAKQKEKPTKAPPSFLRFFTCFSLVFDGLCTFSLIFALFGMSVSHLFWPSIFALFCTIRLLQLSGRHLDSSDFTPRSSLPSFDTFLFCHRPSPLLSSTPQPTTLQGVDLKSIFGHFLMVCDQKRQEATENPTENWGGSVAGILKCLS